MKTPWNDQETLKQFECPAVTESFNKILHTVREAHYFKSRVARFLKFTRPPFEEKDFPERVHEGPCGPESNCDGTCIDIYHMSEYNSLRKQLEDYVRSSTPSPR